MGALPVFLALVVALGIILYTTLDGFDLGVGALFMLAPSEDDRDRMMNSIAPFWDGNETWLVLGGALLFGAFPVAYATLLPAFYLPIVVMLFGLIFRGIAFEFRFKARRYERVWDWAFALGSVVAGFCQGLILGGLIDGVTVRNGAFAGRTFDFLSGFSVAAGCGVVAGYALLGATWLIFKTDGETREFARRAAVTALWVVLLFMLLVSVWTPVTHPRIAARWFAWPNLVYLAPVPILTAAAALRLLVTVGRGTGPRPYLDAVVLFLLGFAGLGISLWPYIVPYSVTLRQAASSPSSLVAVTIGVVLILPINLFYLGYAHWVFRGSAGKSYES